MRFSEFLAACIKDGPQVVTKRGAETAVLVPVDEWRRYATAPLSIKQLLLSDVGRTDALTPLGEPLRPQAQSCRTGIRLMHLLDTNVVSELRKPKPHAAVVAWLQSAADSDLHLSAVTRRNPGWHRTDAGARSCQGYRNRDLGKSAHHVVGHPLPMDGETFRMWARLMHRAVTLGRQRRYDRRYRWAHQLTVVTRNVADFGASRWTESVR